MLRRARLEPAVALGLVSLGVVLGVPRDARAYLAIAPSMSTPTRPAVLDHGMRLDEAAVHIYAGPGRPYGPEAGAMAEGGDGAIWLGVEGALMRLDGQGARTFPLEATFIRGMAFVGDTLLIGTDSDGVLAVREGHAVDVPLTAATRGHAVRAMAAYPRGVFIGTTGGRVLDLDGDRVVGTVDIDLEGSAAPSDVVRPAVQALAVHGDVLAVGTSAGLRFVDIRTRARSRPDGWLASGGVTGLAWIDPKPARGTLSSPAPHEAGAWLVSTDVRGLFRCTMHVCAPLTLGGVLSTAHFGTAIALPDGSGLVASNLGLARVEGGEVTLQSTIIRSPDAALLTTRANMVWVAAGRTTSNFGGAAAFSFRGVATWLGGQIGTRALLERDDGGLLVGTQSAGLWSRMPDGTEVRVPLILPSLDSVRSLAREGDAVVVAGMNGAVRLGRSGQQDILLEGTAPMARLRTVAPIGGGRYALGSTTGLFTLDEKTSRRTQVEGIRTTSWVMGLERWQDGRFLVGTSDAGLFAWTPGSNAQHLEPAGLASALRYLRLAPREEGFVVLHGSGFCAVDDGVTRATCFDHAQGLRRVGHHGAVRDGRGKIWFTTNHGITSLDEAELTAAARGERTGKFESVRHFTREDGLPDEECNLGNPNAIRLRDGRLAFACKGGVVVIRPELASRDPVAPYVVIAGIEVDGVLHDQPFAEPLAQSTQRVTFSFFTPSFLGEASGQQFRVRLDGFDTDWIDGDPNTLRATYTNLPRGRRLRFSVRASNRDGVWNDQAASFAFAIAERWYERLWAQVLIAAGFFGLVALQVKRRTAAALRRAAYLEGIVRERTTDLVHQRDRVLALEARTKELAEVGQAVASTLDIDAISNTLRAYVTAHFDAPTFAVAIVDETTKVLRYTVSVQNGRELPREERSTLAATHLAARCVERKRPVTILDADRERARLAANLDGTASLGTPTDVPMSAIIGLHDGPPEADAPASEAIFQSMVYVPLLSGEECFGVIAMQSPRKNAYTADEIDAYYTLASYASTAIGNALAHGESERLLLNILPRPIAARLKAGERLIADRFEHAAVMFVDVAGFTPRAARLPPEVVLTLLDELFLCFDQRLEEFGVEKVKTIGDAYMAVAGVPVVQSDPAHRLARFALAVRAATRGLRWPDGAPIELRFGLHVGPVVAGVVGIRKTIYDVWGDTVNVASRMESHGTPDRIHVSDAFAAETTDQLELEPRGELEVKGVGFVRTWWLLAPRIELAGLPSARER